MILDDRVGNFNLPMVQGFHQHGGRGTVAALESQGTDKLKFVKGWRAPGI